jgi:hypothetical protein
MWETTVMASLVDNQQINDDTFGGDIKFEPRTIPLQLTAFRQVLEMFDMMHLMSLRVASRQKTGTNNQPRLSARSRFHSAPAKTRRII